MLRGKLITPEILHGRLHTDGAPVKTQSKEVTPTKEVQTVRPDAGYLLSSVVVDAYPDPLTQSKTATPSEREQTVLPDDGYLLDEVTVAPIPSAYHDTSNADIVAEDVPRGKIAYGADGEVVGTSDAITPSGTMSIISDGRYNVTDKAEVIVNTKPSKGLIFEYDSDGYWISARLFGFGENTPVNYATNVFTRANYSASHKYPTIYIDPSITKIPDRCFYGGSAIGKIVVDGSITSIGNWVITNDNGLGQVLFQGNVEAINGIPFYACPNIVLYDFSHCTQIPTISASDSLTHKNNCVMRIPSALSDTTLGVGNGWESATNWCDLTDIVWEVV